jgi:hypothetical protein
MLVEFYRELSLLDKKKDRDLKVELPDSFDFAREKIAVPVVLQEIGSVAKFYPVVFTTHREPMMVAVVGHRENRFLNENGNWRKGYYIPFAIRSYPFTAINDGKDNYLLAVDRGYEGIGKGERIFDDSEEFTDFGKRIAVSLMAFINSFKETKVFIDELKELDLLEPVSIVVNKNGKRYAFTSLQQVSREKLLNLDKDRIFELHKQGKLYYIYLHLFSLSNFENVVD